jgi:hypothetical protein
VVLDFGHELLGDAGPVPLTEILYLAEHVNLPVRRTSAEREVTEWFRLGILPYRRLQGCFAPKVRVFIAVLSSFGRRQGKASRGMG